MNIFTEAVFIIDWLKNLKVDVHPYTFFYKKPVYKKRVIQHSEVF